MGRSPCCSKEGLNRGAWTVLEDKILTDYVLSNGEGGWRNLPQKAGLERCGKSCRLRWLNYLRPDIKRGNISEDEEELIIRLHKLLGNRWSLIAGRLPGRTDNEIKNYWNTNLRKKNPIKKNKAINPNVEPKHTSNSKPPARTTKPEPIRTKAFRCTKTIIPNLQSPRNSHSISSMTLSSLEKQAQESPQDSYNIGVEAIINNDNNNDNNNYDKRLYYETDNPLQFGNLFGEDWYKNTWLDDNVHTDLGYFSFLLDDCEIL